MRLDQSRYKAWHDNQERCRLHYFAGGTGIVPNKKSHGLDRGTAFHLIVDGRAKGWTDTEILEAQEAAGCTTEGIAAAWAMYPVFEDHTAGDKVLASEVEFEVPIMGGHAIVGRLDQVIVRNEYQYLRECKTAWYRHDQGKASKQWEDDIQVETELIGARWLGYNPVGVIVEYTVESTPPIIAKPVIVVNRNDAQLEVIKLSFAETCDQIEMMLSKYGPDVPWPHQASPTYNPFSCQNGRCEYEELCRTDIRGCDLTGFKPREEHLDLMRKLKLVEVA